MPHAIGNTRLGGVNVDFTSVGYQVSMDADWNIPAHNPVTKHIVIPSTIKTNFFITHYFFILIKNIRDVTRMIRQCATEAFHVAVMPVHRCAKIAFVSLIYLFSCDN